MRGENRGVDDVNDNVEGESMEGNRKGGVRRGLRREGEK